MELWDKKSAPPLTQTSCIIMRNGKYVQGYILHGTGSRPSDNPSITSGLTLDAAADDDASLLGNASLYLDQAGEDVSLLGENVSFPNGDVYLLGGDSLIDSTERGHNSFSKLKQSASLITQEFNATPNKEIEYNAAALSEAVALKV